MDLKAAREIERLNIQLEARNELLYQVFGRYFSDQVIKQIFDNPQDISIGGEKKDMTVMMADLRGFTAISQEMESDAMMDLLNFYFGRMIEIIRIHKGTVIEILGDGILAVFGAPIPIENHTEAAITAAIIMQNTMKQVNDYCYEKGYPSLDMGVGIHSGTAFIGNIGSEKVMRYNVIGRVVNECSRIENYSVGGQVLVSDAAIKQLGCSYLAGEKIEIKAKGIQGVLTAYEILELYGKHQFIIEAEEESDVYPVRGTIIFDVYLVLDKFVDENAISLCVIELSQKSAVVHCETGNDISLYSDVKISARDSCNNILFSDIYAKITARTNNTIKLRFTHVSSDFQHFMEVLKREDKGV